MKKGENRNKTGTMPFKKGESGNTETQFEKGESGNKFGRPKKFISSLKAQGYKLSEINDCIRVMLSMTREQLVTVQNEMSSTALEMLIASAIIKAINKGDLSPFEVLLSRTFGKPKEHIEISKQPEIEAGKAYYERLLSDGVSQKQALKAVLTGAKLNGVELKEDDILDADTIS
jgi:Family of unknown function (DUF5681)